MTDKRMMSLRGDCTAPFLSESASVPAIGT
jgi:hypothetical protein